MPTNLVLGIETTTTAGSVVLVENPDEPNERTLISEQWRRDRSHAEVLGPSLERIAPYFSKLSAVAVGQGPGSFTGIRVGINAARALGWSLQLPVVTVSSTENMLEGARSSGAVPSHQLVVAILPAQMGLVFSQWSSQKPGAYSIQDLKDRLAQYDRAICLIGDGSTLVEDELRRSGIAIHRPSTDLDFPTAHIAVRLAQRRLTAPPLVRMGEKFTWQAAQALYIRGSGAEERMS